jgi:hypothetical protein
VLGFLHDAAALAELYLEVIGFGVKPYLYQ